MLIPPKVYIVLVNFNGSADTIECLGSLRNLAYRNFQVIVVDNCSTDESVERLKAWLGVMARSKNGRDDKSINYQSVDNSNLRISDWDWTPLEADSDGERVEWPLKLIEETQNRGFAGGNNTGIRYGLNSGDSEYFWLLNNDTIVDTNALGALVSTFEERDSENQSVAMCGSLILDFDDKDKVQAYGGAIVNRLFGTTSNLLAGARVGSVAVNNASRLPDYVSGCSLLIKSQNIPQTGLLDEDYFLYWEDTEWSFRCKKRGMTLAVASGSRVWHRRGSTSARFPVIGFYNTRNCLWFFREYLPAHLVLCLMAKPLFFSAIALKHRNWLFFRESLRGYVDFLKQKKGK